MAMSASAAQHRSLHTWRTVLLAGLGLWAVSTATLVATDDLILLPAVVMLGSFLVPVACVFWLLEHGHHTTLSPARLISGFCAAGVLGLMAAAALETWLLPERLVPNLWVGLIEEAVKLAGLVAVAWTLPSYRVRDGLILGATVGLGFASFESAGYTLDAGFRSGDGFSASDLVSEELLRAAIAPLGHGVWTGLLGAALFGYSRGRPRPRINLVVIATYLVASVLHALWDASSNAAVVVCVLVTGDEVLKESLRAGTLPEPSAVSQQALLGAIQWVFMGAIAIVGLWLFRRAWRLAPPD
ncbi:PrsW family glutamic-type intramembrane protease [Baekduia sp. Peel2402]|uniref:PrsW family glutamic-type intramembrane protease n=1 Tax=Baekduia sp. Peel2402 TaxID=3458296 RepID=UPI00403EAAA4